MPKKRDTRAPAALARQNRQVWEQERQELLTDLRQLNETLERTERSHLEWMNTIETLRRSKALLLNELARVAKKISKALDA